MTAPDPTGHPPLRITPLRAVVAPIRFATARGDDADPALDELRRAVADVRLEVFVDEQDVPLALEIDARDFAATTIHVLACGADGAPLGAARLLLEPDRPGQVHLGRLAVRRPARRTGLGARLVAAVEQAALRYASVEGAVTVLLAAQETAMGFYRRCGYRVVTGERYLDAGIWHQDMARTLTRS
ncbi:MULTISPECIES: GNAT family N-acetyltransferase [unclassified Actinomyces]|uniref:GNAT family N-acetyltransferase n=1 Tax=unclassified Actinomyces TaxID=2609248 RepID=UPI000D59BF6C|nr:MULTISPECIES: GNAT family N-acetyltransferase [unclassified Actinomyces]RAX24006.1 GNAT family N-acetyltransferase [Actinomyces sp. Z3]